MRRRRGSLALRSKSERLLVYMDIPGLWRPLLGAAYLPTARAASGTVQWSRPWLFPFGPSIPGPSYSLLN